MPTPRPYREFEERVFRHRSDLRRLLEALKADGNLILGCGTPPKGNVVLLLCGIGTVILLAIAEVIRISSDNSPPARLSRWYPRRTPLL